LRPGAKTLHVRRLKGSQDSTHTLDRDEVAGLRKLRETSVWVEALVTPQGERPLEDRRN